MIGRHVIKKPGFNRFVHQVGSNSKMEFTENDWYAELGLGVGAFTLRVWPAKNPSVQSQWGAVDVWTATRSTSLASLTNQQKQKARS